jgi:hypothetical protein
MNKYNDQRLKPEKSGLINVMGGDMNKGKTVNIGDVMRPYFHACTFIETKLVHGI